VIKEIERFGLFHRNGKFRSLVWKPRRKAEEYYKTNKEMKYYIVKKVKITVIK